MSEAFGVALQKGQSFSQVLSTLGRVVDAGKTLSFSAEERALPYLDHVVEGWVDGPPSSVVAFVLCGKDPAGDKWRRFTLSKIAPWSYELGVFPTPFPNNQDPLAPGVPPSSSRRR